MRETLEGTKYWLFENSELAFYEKYLASDNKTTRLWRNEVEISAEQTD